MGECVKGTSEGKSIEKWLVRWKLTKIRLDLEVVSEIWGKAKDLQ